MKHIGEYLKEYIENNRLVKGEIAEKCEITHTYLSAIFHKSSIDCALFDKICNVIGLDPALVFESSSSKAVQNDVNKDLQIEMLSKLLDEKERTIQLLLNKSGTATEQN